MELDYFVRSALRGLHVEVASATIIATGVRAKVTLICIV